MALRDQPYIPLYVDDYLTDEKLNMCSASTQGVYIKILCILHKQTEYGKLLLKQKEKQSINICLNFATKFAKILPFTIDVILPAIEELVEEEILIIDGDCIYQKRMVKDNSLSIIRANSGGKGGKKTQEKNKDFAKAKIEANTVNENEYVIENSLTNSSNNTNGEISKKIALPLNYSEVPNERKNKNKLFTFSEIITELKLEGTQKNLILAQYKTDSNTLNKYIDFFSVQYTPETETETFSLNEKRIHFKNFLKNNWGKLPQQQEQRPKAKLL